MRLPNFETTTRITCITIFQHIKKNTFLYLHVSTNTLKSDTLKCQQKQILTKCCTKNVFLSKKPTAMMCKVVSLPPAVCPRLQSRQQAADSTQHQNHENKMVTLETNTMRLHSQ